MQTQTAFRNPRSSQLGRRSEDIIRQSLQQQAVERRGNVTILIRTCIASETLL
jgi:hypothetical protein